MVRTTRFGFDDGWVPDDVHRDRRPTGGLDDWPDDGDPIGDDIETDDPDPSPPAGRHLAGADWLRDPPPRRRAS